jgi:hypothetical protein
MRLAPLAAALWLVAPFLVSSGEPGPELVLRIDDAHNVLAGEKLRSTPAYEVVAGAKLVLDATGYRFAEPRTLPSGTGTGPPNAIQIARRAGIYVIDWREGTTRRPIAAEVARPQGGAPVLAPFERGERFVVAVGHYLPVPGKKLSAEFHPVWIGMVEVK